MSPDLELTGNGEAYAAHYAIRPAGCPVAVDPVTWRRAVAKRIEELQDAQWALIAALDEMDGDPDLEPSLGAPETRPSNSWGWGLDPVRMPGDGSEEHWADGLRGDHEREDSGDAEPDADGEDDRRFFGQYGEAFKARQLARRLEKAVAP